jgi:hypothetical protein
MKKIFFNIIISTMALALIAGCKTGGLNLKLPGGGTSSPAIVADSILSMPNDASRVILAISAKILNSDKRVRNVTFQSTYPVKLNYAKLFNFNNAVLLKYSKTIRNIQAELFFSDTLGRTCTYSVTASYTMNNNKILIQKYKVTERFLPAENSVCFIFPTGEFENLTKDTLPKSFYELYHYAAGKAVTPKQALAYKNDMDWTIMVFILDRMSKSSDMQLELSVKPGKSDKGYDNFSKYIIYNGWRVGVVTGKFNLLDPGSDKPLYAKVIYNHGGFLSRPSMLGVYKLR